MHRSYPVVASRGLQVGDCKSVVAIKVAMPCAGRWRGNVPAGAIHVVSVEARALQSQPGVNAAEVKDVAGLWK